MRIDSDLGASAILEKCNNSVLLSGLWLEDTFHKSVQFNASGVDTHLDWYGYPGEMPPSTKD